MTSRHNKGGRNHAPPSSRRLSSGLIQPRLEQEESATVVNVATVPQRSPFRYPGGKTWLVPEIRAWLKSLPNKPRLLVEPFAGGAIASLTVVFENLAEHVLMVELDEHVAAVWRIILTNAEWLAEQILTFNVTRENVREKLSCPPGSLKEKAFQALLRNRVQRGGILAPGASLMKEGEKGRGLRSRWYPATLAKRIRAISAYRDRITFMEDDAFAVIPRYLNDDHVAFFVDPPYTAGEKKAGKRLYSHSEVDHAKLFRLLAAARGRFLMTYEDSPEIMKLAAEQGFRTRTICMKNTHHNTIHELLIEPQVSGVSC